jgi:MoaA/NifB/PqqE/SkfB family radical SAM enzyme|tara:strand:+ start:120 stop:1385 length:1266 start_codon:yes stop_codon:yes gene_type:complete
MDNATTKKVLDKISPSFCIAKWARTNVRTYEGTSYSCHHCRPIITPKENVVNDHETLTNNDKVKDYRQQMLDGERPEECNYCWTREDQGFVSDRILKSAKFITEHKMNPFTVAEKLTHDPVHLDIAFDRTCNFKCSYCGPQNSSLWAEEISQYGDIEGLPSFVNREQILNKDENPYNDAFWKWWDSGLKNSLRHLTITGGEPLLSKQFWKVLDRVEEEKLDITVMVNTNLCPPVKLFNKFMDRVKNFNQDKLIVSTSIESTGQRAEYSRYGLNYDMFMENFKTILDNTKMRTAVNLTNNALSFTSMTDIVEEITKFKAKYGARRIILHSNDVTYPKYLNLRLLPESIKKQEVAKFKKFMKSNLDQFTEIEKLKFARTLDVALVEEPEKEMYRDQFFKFIKEYDKRRNLNFQDTFPELARII